MTKKLNNIINTYNKIPTYKRNRFWNFLSFANKLDFFLIFNGIFFSVVQGVIFISFTLGFGNILNAFTNSSTAFIQILNTNALLLIYFGCGIFGSCFIGYFSFSISGKRMTSRMKIMYFKKIMEKDAIYYDLIKLNELNSEFLENTNNFENGFSEKINNMFFNIGVIFGGIIFAFFRGWLISVLVLSLTPILAIGIVFFLKYQKKSFDLSNTSYLKAGSITEEVFSMIKIVKSLGSEDHEIKKYREAILSHDKTSKRYSVILGGLNAIFNFIFFLMYALGLLIGTIFIINRINNDNTGLNYTIGEFVSIFLSIIASTYSFTQLAPNVISFRKFIDVSNKIGEFLETKNLIEIDSDKGLKPDYLNGEIEFRNVSFSYPSKKDKIILNNISFKVNKGETAAFVGESGSGKSTIIQLLERYYDVDEGEILIDGINIKEYNLFHLRNLMGLVSQTSFLLGSTVRNNLKLGLNDDEKVDEEKLNNALKQANALKFVKMLRNYLDSYIGWDGSQFSGGQKQRISISRIILKNPNILILDEATSALDRKNEIEIQNNLNSLSADKTTLIVAHRLSTIEHSNQIYVLKNGSIIESGNHKELIKLGKAYSQLQKLQELVKDDFKDKREIEYLMSVGKSVFMNQLGNKLSNRNKSKFVFPDDMEDKKKMKKKEKKLITINDFFGKQKFKFIIAIIFSILNGFIFPLFGIFYSEILVNLINIVQTTNVNRNADISIVTNRAYILIGIMFGIAVFSFILNFVSNSIFNYIGEVYTNKLRYNYFRCIIYKDLKFFDKEENKPGNLNSQLLKDCKEINSLITIYLGLIIQNLTTIVAGLAIGFYSSWRLTLYTFFIIPLMGLSALIDIDIQNSNNNVNSKKKDFSLLNESINNIKIIWSLSAHKKIIHLYHLNLISEGNKIFVTKLFKSLLYSFSQFNLFGIYALLFYLGGYLIQNNNETLNNINRAIFTLVFTGYGVGLTSNFYFSIGKAINAKNNIEKRLNKINKIENNILLKEILKNKKNINKNALSKIENENETEKIYNHEVKGKIEFKNVNFRYPNSTDLVLKNISFKINPGEKVAFVGNSGCGKSTIIQLLLRFYEIESGYILLDNKNIKNYDLKFLRSLFGWVSQETKLFLGSIKYNIVYNLFNIENNQIIKSSKEAISYDFIKEKEILNYEDEAINKNYMNEYMSQSNNIKMEDYLPKGFYFNVGNRGENLSGGQKQRICITRTLLRDPVMFLFDEATSALDNNSEKIIQDNIDKISNKKTSLFVAHRFNTIKNSNRIFVLDKGFIVEEGNYTELLKKKGLFYNLNN